MSITIADINKLLLAAETADCCLCEVKAFDVESLAKAAFDKNRRIGRPEYALTYVLDGEYVYTASSGEILTLHSGDISWLPIGSRYVHKNDLPAHMYVIYFRLITPDGSDFIPETNEIAKLTCQNPERFKSLFYDVVEAYFNIIRSTSRVKSALHKLLYALLREGASATLSESEHMRLAPAIEYLSNNKSLPSVAELARMCCMSEYSFRELFKRYAGITPKIYLELRRIEQVEALLTSSNISVTKAALLCGFDDPSYFFKMYKRLRGYTPSCFNS